ncbi:hypothetical protein LTR17_008791 [Elasticomyces elasticus]|nr:hypothetical protein LTR17_008791 [Elasticomyces elasticus]
MEEGPANAADHSKECADCRKKESAKWYLAKDENGEPTGLYLCGTCYTKHLKLEKHSEAECVDCQKKDSSRWYALKDENGRKTGRYRCATCYLKQRNLEKGDDSKTVCARCGKKNTSRWYAARDEDGKPNGLHQCRECYNKHSKSEKHDKTECADCRNKSSARWYAIRDDETGEPNGLYRCSTCYNELLESEKHKHGKTECVDCGKKESLRWYAARDEDGEPNGLYRCRICHTGTKDRRDRKDEKLVDQTMHDLTTLTIQAGLDSFFANSRLPHPQAPKTDTDHQAVASAPYTKLITVGSGAVSIQMVVHDERTPPERDTQRLEKIIAELKGDPSRQPFVDHELQQLSLEGFDIDHAEVIFSEDEFAAPQAPVLTSRGHVQDLLTQAALEAQFSIRDPEPLGINLDDVSAHVKTALAAEYLRSTPELVGGDLAYLQPQVKVGPNKGPVFISAVRTSSQVPQAVVNQLHIENQIARNDFYQARRLAEQQDPNLPVVPNFASYHSLVFNGVNAADPFPIYWAPNQSWTQRQFIQILAHAAAQGREVIILIRGLSGHSVFPNVYARIHQRWPTLVVRIAYVFRPQFIGAYNCVLAALYPHRLPRPFHLHVTAPTARNMYHSRLINIWDLEDQFVGNLHSPTMDQVLEWHDEELVHRTGGIVWWVAQLIRARGRFRNRVIA